MPDGRRYVKGDGPTPCGALILGESPGDAEDETGQCFVGRTGQLVDAVFARAEWKRGVDFRITNVLKYKPELYDKGGDIQPYEVARDRPRLLEEFAKADPMWVFAMGAWAGRAVLDEWLTARGFTFGLEWAQGIAFRVPRPDDPAKMMVVVPSFHPAAGFHDSTMASRFWQALIAFTGYYWAAANPRIWAPDDGAVDYAIGQIEQKRTPVALDTEWLVDGTPYCVTASWRPRQGVLTYAGDGCYRADEFTRYILHNAAADLGPLAEMGVDIEGLSWDDTMIAARVVGEPGGLKALATRHLGVRMQDYNDVLAPVKHAKWLDYLRAAVAEVRKRPSWAIRKGREWSLATRVVSAANARVKAVLADEAPIDIEARFISDTVPARDRAKLERVVGPYPVVDLRDVDEDERVAYACRDADTTRRLAPILDAKLDAWGARAAYAADRGMVPVLARIRRVGMAVDREALRALEIEMEVEVAGLHAAIVAGAGREINPASTADIAKVLFDDFGQPARKLTATGLQSTDAKQLEAMRNRLLGRKAEGEIDNKGERALTFLDALVEFRHVAKLKSTNVSGAWQFLDADGRLHPDLRMEAASGRCVAGGRDERGRETPNALAIPTHSKWGKRIRQCFVAGEGRVYVVVDLDQIEMRVMAHLSGDANMGAIFRDGRDIHAETAVFIFNDRSHKYPDLELGSVRTPVPGSVSGVTFRDVGKTLGFGILFGQTEYGAQEQLAKRGLLAPRDEVRDWIEGWMDLFPGVRTYQARVVEETIKLGYSATVLGRRRYVPWIYSPHERDRAEAERQAINHRVQGHAIEIMKLGMGGHVHPWMIERRKAGWDIETVLTVHDDSDVVVDEEHAEETGKAMVEMLCGAVTLSVPIRAKASIGKTWGAAK